MVQAEVLLHSHNATAKVLVRDYWSQKEEFREGENVRHK